MFFFCCLALAVSLSACAGVRDVGVGAADAGWPSEAGTPVDAGWAEPAAFDAGEGCASDLDCLATPWPETCDGDWRCTGGACAAVCRRPECAAAADCESRTKKKACTGHWACLSGECAEVCDAATCDEAADCIVLPWPGGCEGHWECGAGHACTAGCDVMSCDETFPFRAPVTDGGGKILPWTSYGAVARAAMGFVKNSPADKTTGFPWYLQYPSFRYQNMCPSPWPHNPAGLYGMMAEAMVRWWPYTGDRGWIDFTRRALDYLIDQSTPDSFRWARVPYASADNSGRYRGGSTEGVEGIESDKVAQAAMGYLRFYETTGETRYLDEARHCADVLARNVRDGSKTRSPWPFRLNARTGEVIEEYTSDMVWPIALFDEIKRLGLSTPAHDKARGIAWHWLMTLPVQTMVWKGYFEDVILDNDFINREQYTPGETARYLMRHPEADPAWRDHVPALLDWIKATFGDAGPKWLGATGIREQSLWMQLSGSHTARYASLRALWSSLTGDAAAREEALRSFALATYMARDDGVVIFSVCDTSVWFSDGYFDYVPHFIDGMAALPEMAPADEDHMLGSTSVVTDIVYAAGSVSYRTFDPDGTETLRLTFTPKTITAGGKALAVSDGSVPGYVFDPAMKVLKVFRKGAKDVTVAGR